MSKNNHLYPILTFNLYTQQYTYFTQEHSIHPEKLSTLRKKKEIKTVISAIDLHDLQSTKINVPKVLEEHEIEAYLQVQIYEALALPDSHYHISAYEVESHENGLRLFYTFVVSKYWLERYFVPWVNETQYIDIIVPMPLLYETLFSHKLIPTTGVSCFIHENQNYTTLTFYQHTKLLYVKSCNAMTVDLLEVIDEVIEYIQQLTKVTQIEHFYIQGDSTQLSKTIQTLQVHITASIQVLDQLKPSIYQDADMMEYLLFLYAKSETEAKNYNIRQTHPYTLHNMSPFVRGKPLLKRTSGQILILSSLSLVIGSFITLYYLLIGYSYHTQKRHLEQTESTHKQGLIITQKMFEEKTEEKKKLDLIHTMEIDKFNTLKSNILALHDKKHHIHSKSEKIYLVGKILLSHHVQLIDIKTQHNIFYFTLQSQKKKHFLQMVQTLLKTEQHKIQDISMTYQGEVENEHNTTLHQTIIKVDFQGGI